MIEVTVEVIDVVEVTVAGAAGANEGATGQNDNCARRGVRDVVRSVGGVGGHSGLLERGTFGGLVRRFGDACSGASGVAEVPGLG